MKSVWRSPFLTLILIVVDTVALWVLWLGAYSLRETLNPPVLFSAVLNPRVAYVRALPVLLVVWLLILRYFKFYAHHERIASLNRVGSIVWAIVWMGIACTVHNLIFKPDFGRAVLVFFVIGATGYLFVSRSVFRYVKRRAVESGHGRVRVLVVGGGELGKETMLRVREHPDIGFKMIGFIKAYADDVRDEIYGYPALGGLDSLIPVIQRHQVQEVFFAAPEMKEDQMFGLIEGIQRSSRVACKVVANMLYVIVNRAKVDEIIGLPVVAFRGSELTPAHLFVKRLADLLAGGLLGLVMLPFALLFALLIRLDSRGPVLFVHERIGQGGRVFRMYKFRTMYLDSEPYAEAPQDQSDPRVTRFGRFLRKTSLDEIPQVLNVLRGDMSLVGPRPEMPFIVKTYVEWQKARLRVKPGVTGLWQVAGRKNLPLHFNLEYDFYYVKNQSLALDIEILIRTIPAVLLSKGAF
ncbi:sugar transferase [bacterium]|nr:sugar transferase [bacterium]